MLYYILIAFIAIQFEPENKSAAEDLAAVESSIEQRVRAFAEAEQQRTEAEAIQAAVRRQTASQVDDAARTGEPRQKVTRRKSEKFQTETPQKKATEEKNNLQVGKPQIRFGWLMALLGIFAVGGFGLFRAFRK